MKKKFYISEFEIGENSTFIIAEAGVNHNGDVDLAKKLINEAARIKADAIKFQTYKTEELVTKYAPKAEYQRKESLENESQYNMIKKLELTFDDFKELNDHATHKKILFFSTPFDNQSVEFLNKLNVPAYKIGSGDMNNILLLEKIISMKRPILLSTGMSTLEDISEIFNFLKRKNVNELLLFHCITSYPAPLELLNLKFITTLKERFQIPIGFSDHSLGIKAAELAVAVGANAIEKHFTLDKSLPGPDHKSSLEPEEFKNLIESVRFVEKILGSSERILSDQEEKIKTAARKSVIAKRNIPKGTVLSLEDLNVKRPGDGIPPTDIYQLIGKKIKQDVLMDNQITWDMLEE